MKERGKGMKEDDSWVSMGNDNNKIYLWAPSILFPLCSYNYIFTLVML